MCQDTLSISNCPYFVRFQFFKKVNWSEFNRLFNEFIFVPVWPQFCRNFETKIRYLGGLGAKIAILVFAACWSTVRPAPPHPPINNAGLRNDSIEIAP